MKRNTKQTRNFSPKIPTTICLTVWRKISFLKNLCRLPTTHLWRTNPKFLILSNKNKGKWRRRNSNLWLFSRDSWKTLRRNREIDRKESMNFRSAFETKKSQLRTELTSREEIKRLLKLLLMRTKIGVSWRWEKTYTSRSCGTLSWGKRWRRKWETPPKLMKLSRPLRQQQVSLTLKKWSRSSLRHWGWH